MAADGRSRKVASHSGRTAHRTRVFAHFAGVAESGSSPVFEIADAASGDDRKWIRASAPAGFFALVAMPPENTVYLCTSAGRLPTTVTPFTGSSSTTD